MLTATNATTQTWDIVGLAVDGQTPPDPLMPPPVTAFESSGGVTSLADETTFLQQVAAETSATLTTAGLTTLGKTIHRLDIGDGPHTMLIVTLQHGSEVAPREAILAFLRDLAYSTGPDVLAYLAEHRVVYVGPVNAGQFPTHRDNPNGVNLNRDHFQLTQAETQAVAAVIADTQPHLIIDAHERFGTGGMDWEGAVTALDAADPAIRDLADELLADTFTSVDGAGYTHAPTSRTS
ncbi:hypothetical protein ACI78T_06595 [Blastococcus sp. SYSU D00922]